MVAIARGASSTPTTPRLDIWTPGEKLLVDPDPGSLTFEIVDVADEDKECDPPSIIGPVVVDLTAHRIGSGKGHFAAVFTIPSDEAEGAHEIRWTWTVDGASFEQTQRFDVLAGVPKGLGGGYGLVSDFRAEGILAAQASNVRLLKLIYEQSIYIETVTGRFFDPRFLDLVVDGTDSRKLLFLGHPVIALSGVSVLDDALPMDPAARSLVVYNRHMRGQLDPDDRVAPRVEIPEIFPILDTYSIGGFSPTYIGLGGRTNFPKNSLNVTVRGLYGYRDPDGSPLGMVPLGLKKALMLLVRRNLPVLACDEEGFDAKMANRVTGMTTRDQSITFASDGLGKGVFTSDIEIDNLLSIYCRPIRIYAT